MLITKNLKNFNTQTDKDRKKYEKFFSFIENKIHKNGTKNSKKATYKKTLFS